MIIKNGLSLLKSLEGMTDISQKYRNINEYEDRWTVLQGELNEKPIFSRYRNGFDEAVGHPDYPFQIGVAVPLINPTSDGLPTTPEANELFAIEDKLTETLEKNQEAVHVMTITFNGMREFVFYASEWKPEYFEQKVKDIRRNISSKHELQFMMQPDEKWETFRTYSGQGAFWSVSKEWEN